MPSPCGACRKLDNNLQFFAHLSQHVYNTQPGINDAVAQIWLRMLAFDADFCRTTLKHVVTTAKVAFPTGQCSEDVEDTGSPKGQRLYPPEDSSPIGGSLGRSDRACECVRTIVVGSIRDARLQCSRSSGGCQVVHLAIKVTIDRSQKDY